MKKIYMIPSAKIITLGSEANMLLSLSMNPDPEEHGDFEGGMSNGRTPSSFIWGDED